MNRLVAFLSLLLALAAPGLAEQELEIIKLRHRSAEQLIPQLKPFLEPGGTLSGMNYQIFLRASRANREQIRQLVAALDQAPRRLLITVRHDNQRSGSAAGADISGNVGSGNVRIIQPGGGDGRGAAVELRRGEALVRGRSHETRGSAFDRASQQVQVVEGGRAYIHVGQSLPVALRSVVITPAGAIVSESVVYRDLGTGFYAEPRLSGDTVTLEISPSHDTPDNQGPGSANIQRLSTTVSGRLGEWLEIGASNAEAAGEQAGTARYSTRGSLDVRRVLLKVEELP
jgi:hypothetical protein